MSAIRSNPAAVEDQDARQVDDRTHPMRDEDHRSPVALAEPILGVAALDNMGVTVDPVTRTLCRLHAKPLKQLR